MSQIDGHVSVVEIKSKIQSLMNFPNWTPHDSALATELYFSELKSGGINGAKDTFLSHLLMADREVQRFVMSELLKLAECDQLFLISESDFFKMCLKSCNM